MHDEPLPVDVGVTTERLYQRLPEFYREADVDEDYALLRYTSLAVDQAGEIETIYERLAVGDHLSGEAANLGWLTWLAQLVGVRLAPELSDLEKRDAVTFASSGWRGGTKTAVADAAKSVLTGTRYAKVYDHSTSTGAGLGTASEWDVLIVTEPTETPSPELVLDAVMRKNAKPAGVILHHEDYASTWDVIEAQAPTWTAVEALGSWAGIQSLGI